MNKLIYHSATSLDYIHGYMYATDRINKEKCSDPAVLKQFPDVKWVSNQNRIYPCPPGLPGCDSGKCKIMTKDQCNSLSEFAPAPTTHTCTSDSDCSDLAYPANCSKSNTCVSTCTTDDDCTALGYAATCNKTTSRCNPIKPYLEWREPKDSTTTGKCILGDIIGRQYCTQPQTRRPSDKVGVTDVPPFKYNPLTGQCDITQDYCDWERVGFTPSNAEGRPDCKESTVQKDLEKYLVGKTIFRDFLKNIEIYTPLQYKRLADRSETTEVKQVGKDYAGEGIHLYIIKWKNQRPSIGFLADEIGKVYPENVENVDGKMHIVVSKQDADKDKNLNRIYYIGSSGQWLLDNVLREQQRQQRQQSQQSQRKK